MNKLLGIVIIMIIVGGISAYAISPYFTESTINEAIPTGAIIESKLQEKVIMEGDGMMEEKIVIKEYPVTEEMMTEETPMHYAGKFVGVGDGIHDAQGDAYTIPLENDSNILRLENFESTNGPDLYVYLSTDDNASEFINLGELKANKGNQNYEIPKHADITKYNKVLIWCKAFGVLFGSAELSTP